MDISKEELLAIIERHRKWLRGEDGGVRANLNGASLDGASLDGASLVRANLNGASLDGASLVRANLNGASLDGANLNGANLDGAKLSGVIGGNTRIQSIQVDPYRIVIIDKSIVWGGCTKKTVQEWLEYDGSDRGDEDRKYLETVTKPFIRMICQPC